MLRRLSPAVFRLKPTMSWDARSGVLPPGWTGTRASGQTHTDVAGVLQSMANNVFATTHDPLTLTPLGIDLFEARTNSIRNNTMAGASAGSPGTDATNWTTGGLSGLTRTLVSVGTETGINFSEYRFFGTTSSVMTLPISFEGANTIAATPNSLWANSVYCRRSGGSLANLTCKVVSGNFNAVPLDLGQYAITTFVPTTAALATQRFSTISTSSTFSDVTTAYVRPSIYLEAASGVAIDVTLRIGMPQMEAGASVTPVIPTSTVGVARAGFVISTTDLSWYNPLEGTFVVKFRSSLGVNRNYGIFSMNSGILVNDIGLFSDMSGNSVVDITAAGVSQAYINAAPSFSTTAMNTAVVGYANNNFVKSVNGSTPSIDTSGTVPSVTTLHVGRLVANEELNGTLQSIAYYPRLLSADQIQRSAL